MFGVFKLQTIITYHNASTCKEQNKYLNHDETDLRIHQLQLLYQRTVALIRSGDIKKFLIFGPDLGRVKIKLD